MKMSGMVMAAVCGGLMGAAGCRSHEAVIVEGAAYPAMKQSQTLDIHVLRDGTKISMTNTSTRTFSAARMWLNQWYSRELPDFAPGQTLKLGLAEFKDRYGEKYRAGGFWATENPEWLALAQIEDKDELVGLVVIGQSK